MEKNKRDLMILIAILFIGVNYASYTYFIKTQLNSAEQAKNKYINQKQELSNIKSKKQSIYIKQKEVDELKQNTADFDNIVPVKVDTPKLIYDFYNGCQASGVTGQSISFQLLNSSSSGTSGETSEESDDNTNNETNTNEDNSKGKFYTLTIDLKITGNKANVENFIKGLSNITDRKINVKSITISSLEISNDESDGQNQSSQNNIPDNVIGNNSQEDKDNTKTETDNSQISNQISAKIIFYEYIQDKKDGKDDSAGDYAFYDSEKEGFNSISDMFK